MDLELLKNTHIEKFKNEVCDVFNKAHYKFSSTIDFFIDENCIIKFNDRNSSSFDETFIALKKADEKILSEEQKVFISSKLFKIMSLHRLDIVGLFNEFLIIQSKEAIKTKDFENSGESYDMSKAIEDAKKSITSIVNAIVNDNS